MSEWTIRDATHDDMDSLRALWRALEDAQGPYRIFPTSPDAEEKMVRQLAETIDAQDGRVIVVEVSGDAVGMATVWFWVNERGLDPMPVVDLSKVVVLPAWRARGAAQALLDEAESWGRGRGARYLQAHLFAGNEAGRGFWERRGFVPRYESRVRPILPAGD